MENFSVLGLPERLLQSLKGMQFHTPTPIQSQTIPAALTGSDILGSAQTGTGKTAAYGIPLVAHALAQSTNAALVLLPTRELASQVLDTLHSLLGKNSDVKTALLIGGDSMVKQLRQLSAKPRIVVGTPGRINDHIERGTYSLAHTNFLVLDETDRMLDMGFSAQLQEIVRYLPKQRQTLMFSATMAPEIIKIANTYLNNPVRIAIGSTTTPIAAITQEVIKTIETDKFGLLLELLENRQGTVIVFVKTKFGTEKLAVRLRREGHEVQAIHGDLRQTKRERVIKDFRAGKCRVLVATDVAARGLDVPHIESVVNYDLPQCPEDYIHRIGRTGRAGAQGHAMSMVTGQDSGKWRGISRLMSNNGTAEIRMENRIGKPGTVALKEGVEAQPEREDRPRRERSVDVEFDVKPRRFSEDGEAPRRSFGERKPYGDRPSRPFGDRDRKPFGDRDRKPFGERSFGGDRDRKPFGDRPSFGDRPARPFGDRDRKPFGERSFGGDRDRKPFGDRPAFGDRPSFGDRPARPFGDRDRKPFGDRDRKPFGERSFGGDRDRKPFGDRPSFGDRPARPFGDRDRKPFGDRDRKPFGERSFGGDRDRKPFGDRPSFGDRPARPFGDRDRKPFGDRDRKPFGDRKPSGPFVDALVETTAWKRPESSSFGRREFGGRNERSFDRSKPRFDRDAAPRSSFADREKKREERSEDKA